VVPAVLKGYVEVLSFLGAQIPPAVLKKANQNLGGATVMGKNLTEWQMADSFQLLPASLLEIYFDARRTSGFIQFLDKELHGKGIPKGKMTQGLLETHCAAGCPKFPNFFRALL
jgi:hypothetical protein